jgi:integrase
MKNEYDEVKYVPKLKKDPIPFDQFVDEYFNVYALSNMVNPNRNEVYRLKQLKAHFGSKPISEISNKDIEEWRSKLIPSLQPSTLNRILTTLKSIFSKAVEWGKLGTNPATKIRKLRGENKRVRFLSDHEVKTLLDSASPRLKDFIVMALNTGMRKDNLIGLRWEDIDFPNWVIHVLKTKSGKAYEVPINNNIRELIKRKAKNKIDDKVLDTRNLRREWKAAMPVSEIKDFCIHDLRHTFASHLAMKGIELFTIMRLLAQSDIKSTQIYAHLAPNHKKIAVNMLDFGTGKGLVTKQIIPEFSPN